MSAGCLSTTGYWTVRSYRPSNSTMWKISVLITNPIRLWPMHHLTSNTIKSCYWKQQNHLVSVKSKDNVIKWIIWSILSFPPQFDILWLIIVGKNNLYNLRFLLYLRNLLFFFMFCMKRIHRRLILLFFVICDSWRGMVLKMNVIFFVWVRHNVFSHFMWLKVNKAKMCSQCHYAVKFDLKYWLK